MSTSRCVVIVVLAGLLVAGCGDDEENGGGDGGAAQTGTEEQTEPSQPAAQTVDISAEDFKFDPENPKVDKAGTVEFRLTNDGQAPHALEVEGPEGEVESEVIDPGKSTTVKADLGRRGSFVIYCPVGNHRDLGMEGTVQVAGGGPVEDDRGGREDEPRDDRGKDGPGEDDKGGGPGEDEGGGGSYRY
jgi:plastocyanin